ncbi:major capsid protein [Halomonas sp. JS92-SW72]|uniref:major capsid protein n=1 Tax=Halomonas sp. JS92-SW72 TaxID=2306583 RepID=UPI0013C364D2|nr:major capsid protein [Halomonas sp. JS92-SW72]
MRLIKKAKAVVLVPASFLASGAAMAQAIDTTDLVTTIEGATGPIGDVGIAVLSVLAAILVFALLKRVMRG